MITPKVTYAEAIETACKYLSKDECMALQPLQNKVDRLQKKINNDSWVTSPDRMGGAFTAQEISDSQAWR